MICPGKSRVATFKEFARLRKLARIPKKMRIAKLSTKLDVTIFLSGATEKENKACETPASCDPEELP